MNEIKKDKYRDAAELGLDEFSKLTTTKGRIISELCVEIINISISHQKAKSFRV
jgi:hypothetical protein